MLNLVPYVDSQYYYDQSYGISGFTFPFIDLSFTDIVQFYNSNYQWLDFFLVLALLIGISKLAIEDKLGKLTPVILSIILSISFVVFERKSDFNLGDLGPIAVLVVILTVVIFVFFLLKKIFSEFRQHRAPAMTGMVLLGIGVLIMVFLALRNKEISSLSQVSDLLINSLSFYIK